MSKTTERYQAALYQVEGLVLDCVTGFSDDSKTVKQVVAEIYAVGDKIKAEGDPYMMAAFGEIVGRSKEVWKRLTTGHQIPAPLNRLNPASTTSQLTVNSMLATMAFGHTVFSCLRVRFS